MKRFSVVMLSAVVIPGILSGCSQKDEKENIELTLKLPPISMTSVNDSEITESSEFLNKASAAFSKQYKDANVTFKIEEFEYLKEDSAVTGSFNTDNETDILYEGYFNMSTYIHTGRVVPLDDIISDDLRQDVDDSIWEMSAVDGKTYMMPFLSLQNVMIYNKKLFRQCGLDEYINQDSQTIDNWTIEEWETILDTLAEKLPSGCYPMMMYAKNDQGDTHIMTFIRSHGSEIFDENGNFNLETDEGIQGLQWIKDGYDRGWYPPQCENLEIADNTKLFGNNQLALVLSNNASFSYYDKSEYGCVNFPSVNGSGLATSFVTGFEVFDNGNKNKLKAAKAFVKFISETDEWADYSTGGIPVRNSIAKKYRNDIYMIDELTENNKNVVDFTHNNPNWRGVRNVFYQHINDLLTGKKSASEVAAEIDKDCNAAIEEGRKESTLHK